MALWVRTVGSRWIAHFYLENVVWRTAVTSKSAAVVLVNDAPFASEGCEERWRSGDLGQSPSRRAPYGAWGSIGRMSIPRRHSME